MGMQKNIHGEIMEDLKSLEKSARYSELIVKIRELIRENPRNLENEVIKGFMGRRWRNIFISEASADSNAVAAAEENKLFGKDVRSDREKIAFRFLKGEGPEEWQTEMPAPENRPVKNTTLIFCPGLLTGLLPVLAFRQEFPLISKKFSLKIVQSDSHPMRGCEANMQDLLKAVEKGEGLDESAEPITENSALPPKDIFVIAYSKGMSDLLFLLSRRPDLKDRIRCIFSWAGAPGGSYLANSMYEAAKNIHLDSKINPEQLEGILKLVSPLVNLPSQIRRLPEYDIKGALLDLCTYHRKEFLEENLKKIDELNIPIFNITGSTSVTEVPYFQIQGYMDLLKYDANNDMQVTQMHSKVQSPMATDLAMLHGHHWDLSYGPFPRAMRFGSPNLEHKFPREAALSSIIKFALEFGLID
ncbi:MAG TPA: hypothetical protein PL048_07355 [Leptospiraceae bacterium]|nr:hypothetical protein [Leptospiraceae bacterium]HNO25744.1 hypothetical protein [Leptospiraceae bacterium]